MKDQQFDLLYLSLEELKKFISFEVGQNSIIVNYKGYTEIKF